MGKGKFNFGQAVVITMIGFVLGVVGGSFFTGAPTPAKCDHAVAPKFGSCPQIVWEGEVGRPCDKEIAVATVIKKDNEQPGFYAICPQHHGSIWPVKVEPGPPVITPKR